MTKCSYYKLHSVVLSVFVKDNYYRRITVSETS